MLVFTIFLKSQENKHKHKIKPERLWNMQIMNSLHKLTKKAGKQTQNRLTKLIFGQTYMDTQLTSNFPERIKEQLAYWTFQPLKLSRPFKIKK